MKKGADSRISIDQLVTHGVGRPQTLPKEPEHLRSAASIFDLKA